MKTDKCDFCDMNYDINERHYVVMARPSDPTELTSVMYVCPDCAPRFGGLNREGVEKRFEEGGFSFLNI